MSQSYIESHRITATLEAHERTMASISKKSSDLAGRNDLLEKRVAALTEHTEALETRLAAVQHNAQSSLLNSQLSSATTTSGAVNSHEKLHPLHSLKDNKPIKGFPKKESDIRTMSAEEVKNVLKDLESDVTGTVSGASRKEKLREVIGVGSK